MRYDQLSGIIIQGFAAPGCHINQCLHLAVHQLYLFLAQGCQEAVPDFVQEYNMPFCDMTEDSFDFHIVKIPTIWHEINSLENSLQPSFKQSWSLHCRFPAKYLTVMRIFAYIHYVCYELKRHYIIYWCLMGYDR